MGALKRLARFSFSRTYSTVKMKYLNVAEKNDAAKNIAAILSRGSSRKREGLSKWNKIYEFSAQVFNEQSAMIMTSVSGHLLNCEFTSANRTWYSCSPSALFDAPVVKQCQPNMEPIKKTLEREVRNCRGLIIWTDCDREGENIGFEVIEVCLKVKPDLRVYRAKFSEITASAIWRAINSLENPQKSISDAVDVRQELDLRIGAAFTRLQTLRYQQMFPASLSDKLISYGSCQFPTLGFVVDRYKSIEEFIPLPFWKICLSHTMNDLTTEFLWDRTRVFNQNACEILLDICKEAEVAKVISVDSKPKNKYRPLPLDTAELEKSASRKLKINAKETMRIAERLYTQGIISYPRTETNIFPQGLDLRKFIEAQTADTNWGLFANKILQDGGPNPRQGKKSDQAHPPIHPLKHATGLEHNEQRVYEFIVRHFLACCSKDAVGFETTVKLKMADEFFTAKGLIVLERNYLEVYIYENWNSKEINKYEVGQEFVPTKLEMNEGCTSPPKLLTEADLIALMEKHGIGTDATHAEHIETIKSRDYVSLRETKFFVPSALGMGLVEGYDAIGLEVSLGKPTLRADLENDLKLICEGSKDPREVLSHQIQIYRSVFVQVENQIGLMDRKLGSRLNEVANEANVRNGPHAAPRPANPVATNQGTPLNAQPRPMEGGPLEDRPNNPNVTMCNCSRPAVLLIVKKDGPTQGRKFYVCQDRTCNFYLWAPENTTERAVNERTPAVRGAMRGNARGNARGNTRGNTRGNARGNARGNTRGNNRQPRGVNERRENAAPRQAGQRRCGICGEVGHTRARCPNNAA